MIAMKCDHLHMIEIVEFIHQTGKESMFVYVYAASIKWSGGGVTDPRVNSHRATSFCAEFPQCRYANISFFVEV